MYRGEFDTENIDLALNIEDTGGNYTQVVDFRRLRVPSI